MLCFYCEGYRGCVHFIVVFTECLPHGLFGCIHVLFYIHTFFYLFILFYLNFFPLCVSFTCVLRDGDILYCKGGRM